MALVSPWHVGLGHSKELELNFKAHGSESEILRVKEHQDGCAFPMAHTDETQICCWWTGLAARHFERVVGHIRALRGCLFLNLLQGSYGVCFGFNISDQHGLFRS